MVAGGRLDELEDLGQDGEQRLQVLFHRLQKKEKVCVCGCEWHPSLPPSLPSLLLLHSNISHTSSPRIPP